MRILVTGGSGLVGSAIKKASIEYTNYEFIFVNSLDINLLNYNDTLNYFKNSKPDIIIHLAANVGGLFKNMSQPASMFEQNMLINSHVLKATHECGIDKLIACLSTCIFPDDCTYPIDETMLHLGPPHSSNAPYAYAKRMLEIGCEAYSKQYGHKYFCIIPTNIYGPNDNFNLEDSHVIPGLIHKCFLAKQSNSKFIVSGTGKPLRQFIYSYDLAECILWTMEKYNSTNSIILSPDPDSEISIEQVARLIAREFDYEHMMEFDTSKSDGQYKKTASNKLFRELNPGFQFTDIEYGINVTVKWFIRNYSNIRK